jgi:hypothetical protein
MNGAIQVNRFIVTQNRLILSLILNFNALKDIEYGTVDEFFIILFRVLTSNLMHLATKINKVMKVYVLEC